MGGEQDMRKMGGLRKQIPVTYWTMLIGTLAIAGIPGFAGFFSKDEILEAAHSGPHANLALWLLGLVGRGANVVLHVPTHIPHIFWQAAI